MKLKLEFLHKYPFTLKQDTILKKYKLVKQYKTLIPAKEVWCMPSKIAGPNASIWTWTGQELATALVQVFMNQGTTTERLFLWAACLRRFKQK
jgi:hypothetical protein